MSARDAIPTFFLLGEAPRPIGDRFAHVESLKERSRPSDWHIRPHAHDELSHVFLVRAGGGAMHADMKGFHFRAPAVLTVPCRCIHAFEFEPDTSGLVATIGEAHLRRIVRQTPGLERLFDAPSVKTIEDDTALARDLSAVDDELGWNSAFSDAAGQRAHRPRSAALPGVFQPRYCANRLLSRLSGPGVFFAGVRPPCRPVAAGLSAAHRAGGVRRALRISLPITFPIVRARPETVFFFLHKL